MRSQKELGTLLLEEEEAAEESTSLLDLLLGDALEIASFDWDLRDTEPGPPLAEIVGDPFDPMKGPALFLEQGERCLLWDNVQEPTAHTFDGLDRDGSRITVHQEGIIVMRIRRR